MSAINNSWANKDQLIDKLLSIRLKAGNDGAFYAFNVDNVIAKLNFWKQKLPRVQLFYVVKANHSDAAIRTMAPLRTGFDCASRSEIEKVLGFGVHPNRIIYAHPTKQVSFLKFARENCVER